MLNAHKGENLLFTVYIKMPKDDIKEQVIGELYETLQTVDCWGGEGLQH